MLKKNAVTRPPGYTLRQPENILARTELLHSKKKQNNYPVQSDSLSYMECIDRVDALIKCSNTVTALHITANACD
jgi:hypothetical protein